MSNIIQFKRNLTFNGSYTEAMAALRKINLAPGEPIIVSYSGGYFISIGLGGGSNQILPTYDSIEDLNNNINTQIQDILSTYEYDWIKDIDQEASNVTFTRNEITGKITVTSNSSGGASSASDLITTYGDSTTTQQEFNNIVTEAIEWGNI